MTSQPIGRPYPYNSKYQYPSQRAYVSDMLLIRSLPLVTCAPVNYTAGDVPTSCSLGINPTYAVNITTRDHISSTLQFARQNNLRLVTTSTGHDLLGRSDGYGSLEAWLRNYRVSIDYQEVFVSASKCCKSAWTGGAVRIDGAWQWKDVYKVAKTNNVILVGGGATSPGAIGGWPSGGGHGLYL